MQNKEKIRQPDVIILNEEPRGPSQIIEIPVSAGATSPIKFPQTQELMSDDTKTIIIKGMRVITDKVLTDAPLTGGPVAPLTELVKLSVVIYAEGWLKGQMIPILTLNDVADADSANATAIPYRTRTTRFSNWRRVEWNKCLLVASNGTVLVPPYTVVIEVEYERLDTNGDIIYGPA